MSHLCLIGDMRGWIKDQLQARDERLRDLWRQWHTGSDIWKIDWKKDAPTLRKIIKEIIALEKGGK